MSLGTGEKEEKIHFFAFYFNNCLILFFDLNQIANKVSDLGYGQIFQFVTLQLLKELSLY